MHSPYALTIGDAAPELMHTCGRCAMYHKDQCMAGDKSILRCKPGIPLVLEHKITGQIIEKPEELVHYYRQEFLLEGINEDCPE